MKLRCRSLREPLSCCIVPAMVFILAGTACALGRSSWPPGPGEGFVPDRCTSEAEAREYLAEWARSVVSDDAPMVAEYAVELAPEHNVLWLDRPVRDGAVTARVKAGSRTMVRRMEFADRPYVDRPEELPRGRSATWIVGSARSPAATATEAAILARRDAARQIAVALLDDRKGKAKRDRVVGTVDALAPRIERVLESASAPVADRLVRRFTRPYGELWHEVILVDASASIFREAASAFRAEQREARIRKVALGSVWAGSLVGIGGLYLLANTITRGYFRNKLRAGASVAILAVSAVAWMVGAFG